MNILALCNQSEAIEILKTIKADKYLFLCSKKLDQKQLPKGFKIGVNVVAYSHRAMKKGRYYPKMDWSKIEPLSGKLIEDLAINQIETMRMVERIGAGVSTNYTSRLNYYYNNLRYWNHILKTEKINIFYRCAPSHEGYDHVIAGLCKYYNIPSFYGNPFHTLDGMYRYLSRDMRDNFPEFNNELFTDDFNAEENLIMPLKNLLNLHWSKKIPKIKPTVIPKKKAKIQKRLSILKKDELRMYAANCKKINLKEKYIYFPLHYQYEATTCPMGGPFVDQFLAIELLSRLGIKIYVKEHPRISKNRSIDYFKRILRIPNVQLISQQQMNYKLIDNSFVVANITGTAGWEAVLRGKPSIIFGYIHYQKAPGVWYVNTLESAEKAIKEIHQYKPNKNDIALYLKRLEKYIFPHTTKNIILNLKKEISNLYNDLENQKETYSPMISKFDGILFSDINIEDDLNSEGKSATIPDECFKEYGHDLDGCSRQQNEGCKNCKLLKWE